MMGRRALVLQHMADDDLCFFEQLLLEDGFEIDTVHLYKGETVGALDGHDLMICLGGAMDVWQTDDHPWLVEEIATIRHWVGDLGRPYIGICLGHQLLAQAMGGEIGMAKTGEVGLNHVRVDPTVKHGFLAGLSGELPVMQWHHAEVTSLPDGVQLLASSDSTKVQAIAVGDHALGVQFHFEWTLDRVRNWPPGWLDALERELGEGAHARVIADAEPHMDAYNAMARRIYNNFKRVTGLS
jgi:GMP synthase-like glutamine amidotransferase